MNQVPPQPVRWRTAAFGAVKGLLGLVWALSPELIAAVFGIIIGLVVGIVSGTALTASLFEGGGGGGWGGHAGGAALLIPVFTFLGPIFVGVFFGGVVLPSITLAIHALVILISSKDRTATRRLVVLSCALGVFGPALLFGALSAQLMTGVFLGLLFLPVTGLFGLVAGAAYCGFRSSLAGRSVGQWWRDADASMGIAMFTTSLVVWLGTWIPLLLFVAFPVVCIGLPIAIALGGRLWVAGNRRRIVSVVLVINVLHALLFSWALLNMELNAENSDAESTEQRSAGD